MLSIQNIRTLRRGGIGVFATDTIYGVMGSALNPRTVSRIYSLRKRDKKKPLIILIAAVTELEKFGIVVTKDLQKLLSRTWPGKVSVVIDCRNKKFAYLHRGFESLAFRLPRPKALRDTIMKTGPLVSTSANLEGKPPAQTIGEAKRYFGKKIDFYVDSGRKGAVASTVALIEGKDLVILRKGAGHIKK